MFASGAGGLYANGSRQLETEIPTRLSALTSPGEVLKQVIVNVTGSGLSEPVFFTWDHESGQVLPDARVTLEVPQGKSRLV